ncbi:hypothetical protein [Janibacter sp. G1551]
MRAALGEHAPDHDAEGIVDTLRPLADGYDLERVEPEAFWRIVQDHQVPV